MGEPSAPTADPGTAFADYTLHDHDTAVTVTLQLDPSVPLLPENISPTCKERTASLLMTELGTPRCGDSCTFTN